jgi:hypothetical protein
MVNEKKQDRTYVSFYVPPKLTPILDRMKKVCQDSNVSMGIVLNALMYACVDTLETDMPNKRTFTINNKEITL